MFNNSMPAPQGSTHLPYPFNNPHQMDPSQYWGYGPLYPPPHPLYPPHSQNAIPGASAGYPPPMTGPYGAGSGSKQIQNN